MTVHGYMDELQEAFGTSFCFLSHRSDSQNLFSRASVRLQISPDFSFLKYFALRYIFFSTFPRSCYPSWDRCSVLCPGHPLSLLPSSILYTTKAPLFLWKSYRYQGVGLRVLTHLLWMFWCQLTWLLLLAYPHLPVSALVLRAASSSHLLAEQSLNGESWTVPR